MTKIFISYSRADEAFAHKLAGSLEDLGADVWLDKTDIPAGMKWSTAIQQGLDACDVMVIVISPESMASVNVEDEWQYYLDKKKSIIPVLLRPAEVHFQLNRLQHIDFHAQNYDLALKQLHSEFKRQSFQLEPISTVTKLSDTTLNIPPQPSLPVRESSSIDFRSRYVIGGVILLVILVGVIAAFILMRDDDNSSVELSSSDTPTIPTSDPMTRTAEYATATALIQKITETSEVLTSTAVIGAAAALIDQQTQTEVVQATDTISPSGTPNPTYTDTPVPTPSIMSSPIEMPTEVANVELNPDWFPNGVGMSLDNPVIQNDDWTPVIETINGMEMVLVPSGCFLNGFSPDEVRSIIVLIAQHSLDGEPTNSEETALLAAGVAANYEQQEICIESPFWLGRYEVTNSEYSTFLLWSSYLDENYWTEDGWAWLQENSDESPKDYWGFTSLHQPRVGVSFYESDAFARRMGCRLPLKNEWVYAASGPSNFLFPWGNGINVDNPNFSSGIAYSTSEVGSYDNDLSWVGAKDMGGNVQEWGATSVEIPENFQGEDVELLGNANYAYGGYWNFILFYAPSSFMIPLPKDTIGNYLGFRVVCDFATVR